MNQDGLLEIFMGVLLIIFAVGTRQTAFTVFGVVFYIFLISGFERIRERLTYPRIGYAKLVEEDAKKTAGGIALYFVIVLAAMILILVLLAGRLDLDLMRQWSPALAGFLISGGMIYAASKSGAIRYYVFLALAVGLGIAASLLGLEDYLGLTLFLFSFGLVALLWGIAIYMRFTRRFPLPANEGDDVPS
jgi:hypothetical protein